MRASKQLLGLCILFQLVTSGNPTKEQRKPCLTPPTTTSPLGKGLEIYTQVALEFDGVDHSEMDSYVDKVLMNGTRNFILHNYRLHDSMIVFDKTFSQLDDWDKSRFMSLRERVKAKGGKIVASLWWGPDHVSFKDFDKETFQSSVRKFVEIYPVDGFSVALERFDGDHLLIMGELIATFKKLGMTFMTKCNYYDWHRALTETGVPKMADLNVISLEPRFDDEVPDAERGLFLTDAIAEKAIKSATKAGVQTDKLILGMSSAARTYDKSADPGATSLTGYINVVEEFGADPDGDGTVFGPDGRLYYFYSQARALGKVRLAKRYGLHGVAAPQVAERWY